MRFLNWHKVGGAVRVIVNSSAHPKTVVFRVAHHRGTPLLETRASRYPHAGREVRQPAAG